MITSSILLFFLYLISLCFSTISSASFLPISSIRDSRAVHSQFTLFISYFIFCFCKSMFFFVFIAFVAMFLLALPKYSSLSRFWFAKVLMLRELRTWVEAREELLTMLSWMESSTQYSSASFSLSMTKYMADFFFLREEDEENWLESLR